MWTGARKGSAGSPPEKPHRFSCSCTRRFPGSPRSGPPGSSKTFHLPRCKGLKADPCPETKAGTRCLCSHAGAWGAVPEPGHGRS